MLPSDMGESIDDPGRFVITSVCERGTTGVLTLRGQELQVGGIDKTEDVLSPGNEILPSRNIIPNVRKSISPSTQKQFKLARLDVKVVCIGLGQALTDDARIMKLYKLLETLQKRNVCIRDALG